MSIGCGVRVAAAVLQGAAELVVIQANRIAGLETEVAELRRRLGMDSTNSSKPPSSDGLDKPKPRRGEGGKGSGRRRGKQPGAPGAASRLVDNPNETLVHRPEVYGNPVCGAGLADAIEYARQRRQVFELPHSSPSKSRLPDAARGSRPAAA